MPWVDTFPLPLADLVWWAGVVQIGIAAANLFLPSRLRYHENLSRVDPMIRKIFTVLSVYIVFVLLFLAGLCLAFAEELTSGSSLARYTLAFLTIFWSGRLCVQLFFYDRALMRRYPVAAVGFVLAFAYLSAVFGLALAVS